MILGTFTQQPSEYLDYDIYYDQFLELGDTLNHVLIFSDNADLAISEPIVYNNASIVKFYVSGGTNGVTYKITINAFTARGLTKQDEIKMKIKEI